MSSSTKNRAASAQQLLTYFFYKYPGVLYILKWLLICSVLGAFVGSASAGFLASLQWATRYREGHTWIIALLPLAGLVTGLAYYYWGRNVETGNNLILSRIQEQGEKIPLKMAVFVYAGTIVTHLFGGSAGREGTAIQMAGAIADQFSKPFRLRAHERRLLLIAAVAAGFGSVFGTPLAGAVFGLEVFLIGRIRYDAIFPAFAAAILADVITKLWQVGHVHYEVAVVPSMTFLGVAYSVMAGLLFGICAAVFSCCMHWAAAAFKTAISYAPLRPVVGGCVVALAVFVMGTTRFVGLGVPTIVSSFANVQPASVFLLKMIFTLVTLSAGFKGGEVTPLFFIGATLGSALSLFIPLPVALLAGMGFVGVFSGATNTPLACTLMGIELFGAASGVYVGVACVVSYLMSGHRSIYDAQIIGEAKNSKYTRCVGKMLKDL